MKQILLILSFALVCYGQDYEFNNSFSEDVPTETSTENSTEYSSEPYQAQIPQNEVSQEDTPQAEPSPKESITYQSNTPQPTVNPIGLQEHSTINVEQTKPAEKIINGERKKPHTHHGFYNSVSVGYAYTSVSSKNTDNDYSKDITYSYNYNTDREHTYKGKEVHYWTRDIEKYEFEGNSFPYMEFKFGAAVANLIAFHTVFNINAFLGDCDYKDYHERKDFVIDYEKTVNDNGTVDSIPYATEISRWFVNTDRDIDEDTDYAVHIRTTLGFGFTLYPFMDKVPAMEGFFLGGSIGFTGGGAVDYFISMGTTYQAEIGKEWWVSDNLSLGIGFLYTRINTKFEDFDGTENTFGIMFRITRG
ncbi:MAG: hypothetical protein HUK21_00130 [Fibrobacteraceae bacterium]|nr:hypothetical protein [Fibrobacteraceae bacterium]